MTTTNSSTEERLSRLEGTYEHLATKEDVAKVETQVAQLETKIAELQALVEQRFANQTRWFVGFMLSGMAFMTAVAFGIARLVQ
ncbi:MAG: hypothetical protein OXI91_11230 [Chloroflexota bacterium]|nr:hypothetical protein [Chloroflexota bacterium]